MRSVAAVVAVVAVSACSKRAAPATPVGVLAVRYDQHVFAGGAAPPGDSAANPFHGDAKSAKEGEQLFSSMNCDGCHGGGATGWVAPALNDGRWRYGASDAAIYQSIFYGRPKGMPAFGGLLQPALVWKLVSYVQTLPLGKALPTQSW